MDTFTISAEQIEQLAKHHIHLTGSEMNMMSADTTVDSLGLHITGSAEAVTEVILVLGHVIGLGVDDDGYGIIDALNHAEMTVGGDVGVHLPGIRIQCP